MKKEIILRKIHDLIDKINATEVNIAETIFQDIEEVIIGRTPPCIYIKEIGTSSPYVKYEDTTICYLERKEARDIKKKVIEKKVNHESKVAEEKTNLLLERIEEFMR